MATNHLALSDEDFLKQPLPETEEAVSDSSSGNNHETSSDAEVNTEAAGQGSENKSSATSAADTGVDSSNNASVDSSVAEEKPKESVKELSPAEQAAANILADQEKNTPSGSKVEEPKPEEKAAENKGTGEQEAPNYEQLYKKMMAPFVANGKQIEPKTPEELIQLAQMGANYTRKLQELAPNRKIITMLGNHDLLDENKLSFLIALDKKDPEAIKKLIMDSGIDPLDIDTKVKPAYQEGSYQVSDQEVNFRTHLDDVTSSETGKQMLLDIEKTWDQASKDLLWDRPEVMTVLRDQRELGIYDRITAEMDRAKTLGKIPVTTPFLEAYKIVGDALQAAGAFADLGKEAGSAQESKATTDTNTGASAQQPAPKVQEPVVITTRAAAPKPTVNNGDKAGAAAPSRSAPGKAKEAVNFFAMSDDDFLKASNLQGRI